MILNMVLLNLDYKPFSTTETLSIHEDVESFIISCMDQENVLFQAQ